MNDPAQYLLRSAKATLDLIDRNMPGWHDALGACSHLRTAIANYEKARHWQRIDDDTPYQEDIEVWGYRMGKAVGQRTVVGWNGLSFDRDWVTVDGIRIAPTHWRPLEPPPDV